jgi:hypothetical protein
MLRIIELIHRNSLFLNRNAVASGVRDRGRVIGRGTKPRGESGLPHKNSNNLVLSSELSASFAFESLNFHQFTFSCHCGVKEPHPR